MSHENAGRLRLAKELGIDINEVVLHRCLEILELGCSPESLSLAFIELHRELNNITDT